MAYTYAHAYTYVYTHTCVHARIHTDFSVVVFVCLRQAFIV